MMGTDSGAGEGAGDHTIFGLIYDLDEPALVGGGGRPNVFLP